MAEEVARITNGAGVAAVYDGVGASTFDASLASLRPRGYLVLFGASSGPVPPVDPRRLQAGGSLFLTRPTLAHYIAEPGGAAGALGRGVRRWSLAASCGSGSAGAIRPGRGRHARTPTWRAAAPPASCWSSPEPAGRIRPPRRIGRPTDPAARRIRPPRRIRAPDDRGGGPPARALRRRTPSASSAASAAAARAAAASEPASSTARTNADPTMTPSAYAGDLGGLVGVGDAEADPDRQVGHRADPGHQRRARPTLVCGRAPVTPITDAA